MWRVVPERAQVAPTQGRCSQYGRIQRANEANPTVFISYFWDDDAHKEWVKELATQLRADGVDARLDHRLAVTMLTRDWSNYLNWDYLVPESFGLRRTHKLFEPNEVKASIGSWRRRAGVRYKV
jgi:hypothetical protein